MRAKNYRTVQALLEAFRKQDLDQLTALFDDDIVISSRSYAVDASVLNNDLSGKPAATDYYAHVFSRFSVESVDVVASVSDEWYLFVDLLWEVNMHGPEPSHAAFRTVEVFGLNDDGRIQGIVGGGTPIEAIPSV